MRRPRHPSGIVLALGVALLLTANGAARAQNCLDGSVTAAAQNATASVVLAWAPFGRAEAGWRIYIPLIAREIGTTCPPATPGFAAALARFQRNAGRPPTGVFDPATFAIMKARWQQARPFVRLSARRVCPEPPLATTLAATARGEGYLGKHVLVRPAALAAWRKMRAAARAAVPAIAAEPRAMTIYSGFRDPAADAARCLVEGNCDGTRRARCSPHRTGLALDMWVGQAPGYGPDSSVDSNRLAMANGPTYRWMVANAARFGFVSYAFEPWHWEWTGEPI